MSMNPNDPTNPNVPGQGGSVSPFGAPNASKSSRSPLMVVLVLVIAVAVAVGAFFGVRALMSKDSKPTTTVTPTSEGPTTDPTTPADDFEYEELGGKKLEFQDFSVEFIGYADDVSNFVDSHESEEVPAGKRPAAVHVRYTNLSDAPILAGYETPIVGYDANGEFVDVLWVSTDVLTMEYHIRDAVKPGETIEFWAIYVLPEDEHSIEFSIAELNDVNQRQEITIP